MKETVNGLFLWPPSHQQCSRLVSALPMQSMRNSLRKHCMLPRTLSAFDCRKGWGVHHRGRPSNTTQLQYHGRWHRTRLQMGVRNLVPFISVCLLGPAAQRKKHLLCSRPNIRSLVPPFAARRLVGWLYPKNSKYSPGFLEIRDS